MINLPVNKLESMDRVDVGGRGYTADVIRSHSAGREYRKDLNIPVHTATVIKHNGQIFLGEMNKDGLQSVPLFKYQFKKSKRFLLGIYRHKVFEEDAEARKKATSHFIKILKESLTGEKKHRYAWLDLPTFVFPFWRDRAERICSERHVDSTKKWINYKNVLDEKIMSPFGLSLEPGFRKIWEL